MLVHRHSIKLLASPAETDHVEVQLISEPTHYLPGTYKLSFELLLPGDIATTDSFALTADNIRWNYHLVATAIPVLGSDRKMTIQQSLVLRSVHPESHVVPGEKARYRMARNGAVECSIFAPTIVDLGQKFNHIHLDIRIRLLSDRYRVQKMQLKYIPHEQTLILCFGRQLYKPAVASKWDGSAKNIIFGRIGDIVASAQRSKDLCEKSILRNVFLSPTWGQQTPLSLGVELASHKVQLSEDLVWLELSHYFEATILFKEKSIETLKAKVVFKARHFTQSAWVHSTIEELHMQAVQQQMESHELQEEQVRKHELDLGSCLPDCFESFDQTNGYAQLPSYQESPLMAESV
ncbi:hypothetical protein EMPS_05825 [Entomortierella parvispora]|uniref:Uncharacterized protein n=1 Tax=Entomortierella parvispora TaxID=205924 RepID=A0A9P3HB84_9FUNG|nr:hypothetical protein EMPS_05825 [Entomortierella parvispora]